MQYSVILPTLNENGHIEKLIISIEEIFNKNKKNYEIIVVDDQSVDGTIDTIKSLAKRDEKHDKDNIDDEKLPEANKVSGTTLRALTIKNRFVPPFLEGEMYLNFRKGLDKYSGLKEMAVNHGVILQTGSTFVLPPEKEGVPGKKLGYYKNWKSDTELWEKIILPKLEKKLKDQYSYSS